MRVILADDQPAVRSAIRLMLEEKPGVNAIAEVSTSRDLLRQAGSFHPDLIFLDWELPETNSKDMVPLLKSIYPHLWVIALSASPTVRQTALDAGVNEFVCKSNPPESLLRAMDNYYRENTGL